MKVYGKQLSMHKGGLGGVSDREQRGKARLFVEHKAEFTKNGKIGQNMFVAINLCCILLTNVREKMYWKIWAPDPR